MNRGMYIGATSLVANQRRLDVLSNNLANINTAGYKRDISLTESFPEKLLAKTNRVAEIRNMPGNNEIQYENAGDLHRARTNDGYFVVNTPNGKSYVKEIQFVEDEDGYLKTSYKTLNDQYKTDYENTLLDRNGNPVQGADGIEDRLQGLVTFPPPHVIGTMNGGVKFQKLFTDFTAGGLMDTGGNLDFALKGEGFFKIEIEDEVFYSRNGSFTISEGYLSDLEGNRVLGRSGEISLDGGQLLVMPNGNILIDDVHVDTLDIVNINNTELLRKRGDNLFYVPENAEIEEEDFTGQVLQSHLETSNMNAISGMVEMINLLREFEAVQKTVKMQDEMLEKAANELGRL